MQKIFENRLDAATDLTKELRALNIENPIVLALPRGGTELACVVAKNFGVKADVLLVRKIGAPFNHELALGAVVEAEPPVTIFNRELIRVLKIEKSYLDQETKKQIEEIERRKKMFRGGRSRVNSSGRVVVVVDDGVATGASVRAALQVIRAEKPRRLILAIPVAPADLVPELRREVDDLICLKTPEDFVAVAQFYRDFRQVTDDDVSRMLGIS